ncbi:putative nuclease HARBI1 [Manihot esculenta]|uniref:putative nuclease HARBI1 n=1 Tax=Manihot esculenta TaxID=3983 RepID=UPI000B5D88AF|nr:putative nuclease HARBI1 [Manihot esculenta]
MDFYVGDTSHNDAENSSSSSDIDDYISDDNEFVVETQAVHQQFLRNKIVLQQIQDQHRVSRGGSVVSHVVINRDREAADRNLFLDYFSDNPRFNDVMFRRRYRMSRNLFLRIVDAIKAHDTYFEQQRDAVGKIGLSTLQKITAVFRMLAYGLPANATDEYVKIGESTAIESLKRFCQAIVEVFGEQYLRSPTAEDVARLLYIGEQRGFPGMLGSLDCMHWKWKNCPTAWAGQYTSRSGSPTIILEVVADYDLWIWHAYFGMPGSNNDINVLESSHLFSDLAKGIAPPAHYIIQGNVYNTGYYLADGIYPKWSTIVQTIREPQTRKKKYFAMKQESCRKDVERAFGVLQSRFAIVAGPSRFWKKKVLHDILTTCIIMHNMIIEDERDFSAPIEDGREFSAPTVEMAVDETTRFQQFLARHKKIKDKDAHFALRNALIEHL